MNQIEISQSACIPVASEFGAPPDVALLQDPSYTEVINDITSQMEATNQVRPGDLETGVAAGRALTSLGCAACQLEEVCTVSGNLQQKVERGHRNAALIEKVTMLASAPSWLTAARLHNSGKTLLELEELSTLPPPQIDAAIKRGQLDLDALLGGVKNTPEGLLSAKDLPGVKGITTLKDIQLAAHTIQTKSGDTFLVIDASEALSFKGTHPSLNDYGNLTAKLLNRMSERGPDGLPQVFSPDSKMQSPLKGIGSMQVDEIRMNGKNRLYIGRFQGIDGEPHTIVIFGVHGGDAQTQREFIDVTLAGKS